MKEAGRSASFLVKRPLPRGEGEGLIGGEVTNLRSDEKTWNQGLRPLLPCKILYSFCSFCHFSQQKSTPESYLRIPVIDLDRETSRQVVVDREEGQYLGHPTTVLLEDGKTILIVYPKGHGRGEIVYKRSTDGGLGPRAHGAKGSELLKAGKRHLKSRQSSGQSILRAKDIS